MFWADLLSIIRSLNTVYTAIGICHASPVDCLPTRSGWNSLSNSLTQATSAPTWWLQIRLSGLWLLDNMTNSNAVAPWESAAWFVPCPVQLLGHRLLSQDRAYPCVFHPDLASRQSTELTWQIPVQCWYSWWWAVDLSETCGVLYQNKLEK